MRRGCFHWSCWGNESRGARGLCDWSDHGRVGDHSAGNRCRSFGRRLSRVSGRWDSAVSMRGGVRTVGGRRGVRAVGGRLGVSGVC